MEYKIKVVQLYMAITKTEVITVRLTIDQKKELEKMAKEANTKTSKLIIRKLGLKEVY